MPRDPEKYLFDVLDSCRFLLEFTSGRTLEDLRGDRGFRSAVERELQIIGEAVLQLSKLAPAVAERFSEHSRIIGFRHILVHGYDVLDLDLVWAVVREKLPTLRAEAEALLGETREQP
jgi:uncharacterized protein with HEPN domain